MQIIPAIRPPEESRSAVFFAFALICTVAILEGAVRRWVSPTLYVPLVMLRDVIALVVVLEYFRRGCPLRSARWRVPFQALMLWSAILLVWALIQLLFQKGSPLGFTIGIRFWILYPWLMFSVANVMSEKELSLVQRLMLLLFAINVAVAVPQHLLPFNHPINGGQDAVEGEVFLVTADTVRTSGTFTFAFGYTCFLGMLLPILMDYRWKRQIGSGVGLLSTVLWALFAIAVVTSGSRGALFFTAIVIGACALLSLFVRRRVDAHQTKSALRLFIGILLFSIVVLLASDIFATGIQNLSARFFAASQSESIFERLRSISLGEAFVWEQATILGFGLGTGNNATTLIQTGVQYFALAETEAGRILLELGALGFLAIVAKALLLTLALILTVRHAFISASIVPLGYWLALSISLLTWPVSGQNTANALAYILGVFALRSLSATNR